MHSLFLDMYASALHVSFLNPLFIRLFKMNNLSVRHFSECFHGFPQLYKLSRQPMYNNILAYEAFGCNHAKQIN